MTISFSSVLYPEEKIQRNGTGHLRWRYKGMPYAMSVLELQTPDIHAMERTILTLMQ
jgi:hypothetical protein